MANTMYIRENVELKNLTTFDIGGAARYFASIHSAGDARDAVAFAREKDMPFYVLGGGSNILFSDKGYDGLIMHITADDATISDTRVTVGAGKNLRAFLDLLAESGLSGLEKMYGIPGSLGGAVRGNAEAFGNAISDCLSAVEVFDTVSGDVTTFSREASAFTYRNSFFKMHPELIILGATFDFTEGSLQEIRALMDDTMAQREARHIQNIKSAGSFFMNPTVERELQEAFKRDTGKESRGGRVPAGWLLERAGIDQKSVGDAKAGQMHANYFINTGDATADDVLQLASLAKTRVRNEFGVQLKEEVQLVGF